ncbi:mucosa-associated lymphoid tissue lymphoma translocation protein 1-like isoform X2 [Salvelinus namaycush]|uniref:Mucosa-associated lymphoid tissue lymphoma translocation protein 1-like isoform X2 n=1 Tax=Salvelinus namaycush TaxID=8040 RepID=A0A8U1BXW6_SALNM|nr:mucosa-associated lymphoid tissue lymphoma translocation protein 1-like isoform X2 [Salvelinus namaycush]
MKNMIRDIVIVQHPVSVYVPLNYKVTLSVRAEGTGILNYQWFKSSKEEVFGGTRADLIVTAQRSQLYICRVNDQFCNCVFSEWVKVKVLDIAKPGLPVAWRGEPHIAVHPAPQTVRQGERLTLSCTAFGIPTPHYQWYRNGHPLLGKTTDTLQIENAESDHRGTYLCYVSNVLEERWTEAADVEIVPSNQLTATDKVALLIGNLNYSHHPDLMAPTMDVHELANLLQQLGFRVVSLLDLTREEMLAAIDKFLLLLDRGVYDLGRDPFVTGKQAVEIKHTLKEPRSLTDPIRTTGHTGELHMRDACWRQANELPRQKLLIFTCGVEVEVSFSALFSNVMVAFGTVKTTGPRAQDCTITLRSTPAMEDIFSSPGRSGEMDSLLLNNLVAENPDCSLRLCGLQKLQGSLVIKVDLHYTHMDRKLRLQESKQLDIGKPLVASCDLHRGQQAMVGQRPDGATAQSMGHSRISHSKQRPRQTLGQPGRPFTKRAECAAKVLTARSNEPGENDETEPQDFTS